MGVLEQNINQPTLDMDALDTKFEYVPVYVNGSIVEYKRMPRNKVSVRAASCEGSSDKKALTKNK